MQITKDKIRDNIKDVPVLNIKVMTDEEWNRLAYKNYLERQANAHARA